MSIRSMSVLTASPALLPCWKCGQEAIAYSYTAEGPGLRWLYAVNPNWPERIIRMSEDWHICGRARWKIVDL